MPRRSVSVFVRMRRSSSPSASRSTTAAAVRNACTRCVGSRARSSRKAILRSAPAGVCGAASAVALLLGLLLVLLRGLLLRLGRPLLRLGEALLGGVGGLGRRTAGAVPDRRLALGVDGGQQQPAEQAGVLQEVGVLAEPLGRVGVLPEA